MRRSRSTPPRLFAETLEPRVLLSVSTIWNTAISAPEWDQDSNPVELGVKFQATVPGFIYGVRFLKGPDNIGTHTGHLWDSNGTLLATVTFTNESPTGWQEADFSNPVAILANHTYIVSYYAPNDRYSYTYNYFTGTGATSSDGRLTALASGTDGPNGVYQYGPVGSFPSQTFRDLNYWVDPVFSDVFDHPPTAIALSNNSVPENQPIGTTVGSLSTTDADAGDTFTYSLVSGAGSADNASFSLSGATLKTTARFDFESKSAYSVRVRSTDAAGFFTESVLSITVANVNDVISRQLFYNNSPAFDTAGNDGAIAADKTALLPGQTASFANYSSYTRGINGLMIDTDSPITSLALSDFSFKVGNSSDPATFTSLSTNPTILLRLTQGVAGSNRIELTWPDNTIQNQWLQVTVRATPNTKLAADDVFYFGNAVADSGNSPTDARVDAIDVIEARAHAGPAGLVNNFDFNRDGVVDGADQTAAAANPTNFTNDLNLITPPATANFPLLPDDSLAPAPRPAPLASTLVTPVGAGASTPPSPAPSLITPAPAPLPSVGTLAPETHASPHSVFTPKSHRRALLAKFLNWKTLPSLFS